MSSQRMVRMLVAGALLFGFVAFVASCQKKPDETAGQPPAPAVDSTQIKRLEAAQQIFLANCAMCHGESGAGDGPLAEDLKAQGVARPAVLNDRTRLTQLGHAEIARVIAQGGAHTGRSNLMPPWSEKLDRAQIEQVADFVMALPDLKPRTPASTLEKYLEAPPGTPAEGRRLFVFYCTTCHGPYAKGDGMLADTLWARNRIRPRNLTDSVYLARKTDQELYTVVALGGGHAGKSAFMPAWTVTLSPAQIKDLVSYVRAVSRTTPIP